MCDTKHLAKAFLPHLPSVLTKKKGEKKIQNSFLVVDMHRSV